MYNQMSSSSIEVMTHLVFISQIIPGYKINVRTNTVVNAESSLGSIMRYLYGESRQETLKYINNVITRAIEITPREDPVTRNCLIDAMRKAIEGIDNLKATYEDDIYYNAELSSEKMRIEHFIQWMLDTNRECENANSRCKKESRNNNSNQH